MTTLARDEPLAAVSAEERLAEVAPMVRRMCKARLGSWDGDDAAQEVLLRLWRLQQRSEFSAIEPAPLFGLAAMNARWQVSKTFGDSSRRAVPAGELADALWVDPQAGPEEQAERRAAVREAQDQLAELIPRLSLRERQVILASQFGTRSNGETAARLGISERAAAVAKQNAIVRMRELVGLSEPGSRAEQRAAQRRATPEYRAAAQRREAQQAALVAAAEQLPASEVAERAASGPMTERPGARAASATSGDRWRPGRAGWPEEVHHAGRAAVRDGWRTEDVVRELGVGKELVAIWRRASAEDSNADTATGGSGSTSALLDRAHRTLAQAQRRRSEVDAHARVFGAPRGRGPVPDIIAEKAREAARSGWTPAELERGFAISRATAKRWTAEESQPLARGLVDTREEHAGRVEAGAGAVDDRPGRPLRAERHVGGGGRVKQAESDGGRGDDPLVRARRAVAALPSPAEVCVAAEEREQAERSPVAALDARALNDTALDDTAGLGCDTAASGSVVDDDGRADESWSAA